MTPLQKALQERILLLDGAMGTAIQACNLSAKDFGGSEYEGCNENLVLTQPDLIEDIHLSYLKAGADILETNTFGGTPFVLGEYGLSEKALEINCQAAKIARKAIQKSGKEAWVAGSIGPTTKAISVTGGISFAELVSQFRVQVEGLFQGGVDYFLIETAQDTRNVKAALLAVLDFSKTNSVSIPIAVSGTIEPMGTMLAGQSVEALWASIMHIDLLYIGLNCATGPEFMTDSIRSLAELSTVPIACVPNAGLPDEDGNYLESPSMMGKVLNRFLDQGWINLLGGCCGTTAEHIAAFSKLIEGRKPRVPPSLQRSLLSGVDFLEVTDDQRPIIVGERTNVIGSRKFKELVCSEKWEEAVEIGRTQVKNGAQVLDICLANPDRDELQDMEKFLEKSVQMIRVPLMIDSTDARVIERALTYCQGKSIINSVNLEDGEERFEAVVPLAKKFGAALVVGTIDEDPNQGMGITRDRKLEIAQREYELLTKKYGISPSDIYWDPLVFPCATGDEQYVGSAIETIEGLRKIKTAFPQTKSILGISNVSFGLPVAGREVLNSVFLYHCTLAGLDLAIVNSQLLQRYPSIPEEERRLAEDLLFVRNDNAIANFAQYFRGKKKESDVTVALPLQERLARYIVEGTKNGLVEDLEEARKTMLPLEIINGPLMQGMDEVGRLFNQNELIVAEVLQSAEAMKAAVSHLEPFMEKADSANRGKILLATVKGDVHDIGKNLVDIILSNNGFEVINLGIKIPSEVLIQAVREHKPDIIGLSGLLVKSAQMMVTTAEDLRNAGITIPILVGGAALSRNFTVSKIAPAYSHRVEYASDAMNGLDLAKAILSQKESGRSTNEILSIPDGKALPLPMDAKPDPLPRRSSVSGSNIIPRPPDYERHLLRNTPLDEIWKFINPRMLFGRHLGLPNSIVSFFEKQDFASLEKQEKGKKALEIWHAVEEVKAICRKKNLLRPGAIYRFFHAASIENHIELYDSKRMLLGSWEFPRQISSPHLCLADFVSEKNADTQDNICLFVVTSGYGVRALAEEWKSKGNYLQSHILSALALESAEGYAEWLHKKIREMWGLADPALASMRDLFQGHYMGKRYSFGYPACPDLEGQRLLFDLLGPKDIGVELTDGFMMDPEASVSALVFHHPEAKYFKAP